MLDISEINKKFDDKEDKPQLPNFCLLYFEDLGLEALGEMKKKII